MNLCIEGRLNAKKKSHHKIIIGWYNILTIYFHVVVPIYPLHFHSNVSQYPICLVTQLSLYLYVLVLICDFTHMYLYPHVTIPICPWTHMSFYPYVLVLICHNTLISCTQVSSTHVSLICHSTLHPYDMNKLLYNIRRPEINHFILTQDNIRKTLGRNLSFWM